MTDDSLLLICPSNSSLEFHPDNNASSFTVQFPGDQNLPEGDWDVSLYSMTYPNDWGEWTHQNSIDHKCYCDMTINGVNNRPPIYLPPGTYKNRAEVFKALAWAIEKARAGIIATGPTNNTNPKDWSAICPMFYSSRVPDMNTNSLLCNSSSDLETAYLYIPPGGHRFYFSIVLADLLGFFLPIVSGAPNPNGWLHHSMRVVGFHSWVDAGYNASSLTPVQINDPSRLAHEPWDIESILLPTDPPSSFSCLSLGFRGSGGSSGRPYPALFCVGHALNTIPFRTHEKRILLYWDIVQSTIMGQRATDLLKEIVIDDTQNNPATEHPQRPMWLPIRKRVFSSITFEMRSSLGIPIYFGEGITNIVLQFKRRGL